MAPATRILITIFAFATGSALLVLPAGSIAASSAASGEDAYPWSSDAARLLARVLVLTQPVGADGQSSSRDRDTSYARANRSSDPLTLNLSPSGNGSSRASIADAAERIQAQRWRAADLLDRNQQQRGRATEMLARAEDQRRRALEMLDRMQEQRARALQMMDRVQDQRWRASDMLSRIQDQRWRAADLLRTDRWTSAEQLRSRVDDIRSRYQGMPHDFAFATVNKSLVMEARLQRFTLQYGDYATRQAMLDKLGKYTERYTSYANERVRDWSRDSLARAFEGARREVSINQKYDALGRYATSRQLEIGQRSWDPQLLQARTSDVLARSRADAFDFKSSLARVNGFVNASAGVYGKFSDANKVASDYRALIGNSAGLTRTITASDISAVGSWSRPYGR